MNPLLLNLLVLGLIMGTAMAYSSWHWLLAWMGLEIGTFAILPLMAQHHHPRGVEAATKYFIIQAIGAALLLFATLTNAWVTGQWNLRYMPHPLSELLITFALALKMGLAPLHTWVPEVIQGLDLPTGLLLATWQKLAPFGLLMQISPAHPHIMLFLGLLSALIGGWGGLNQTQLRKILAYSSIAHLGWVMVIMQYAHPFALIALLTYFATTFSTFLTFKLNQTTSINQLSQSWAKTPVLTAFLPLIMLSLAGLPPLLGFTPKWLIINELVKQDLAILATLMALTALLSLFFYTRLAFAMALTMPLNNSLGLTPWRLQSPQNTWLLTTTTSISILSLPITPAIVLLFLY